MRYHAPAKVRKLIGAPDTDDWWTKPAQGYYDVKFPSTFEFRHSKKMNIVNMAGGVAEREKIYPDELEP